MGDCRIRFQVSSTLLRHLAVTRRKQEGPRSSESTANVTSSRGDAALDHSLSPSLIEPVLVEARNHSSDTTIRELIEDLSIPASMMLAAAGASDDAHDVLDLPPADVRILHLLESHEARLWDCTRFPPEDVSSWPMTLYPNRTGLKCRTLYGAGWFPGGTLLLLPYSQESPTASDARYDDPQYNRVAPAPPGVGADGGTTQQVQLRGVVASHGSSTSSSSATPRPTPSQVLSAVADRSESSSAAPVREEIDEAAARAERQANQRKKRAAEAERLSKLEARIRNLDEASTKNKKVSDQVQRMLIKSRATGRSDLKVQDRFYVRCVVTVDDGTIPAKEEFRYVSRQDTVGRILSSFVAPTQMQLVSELLVLRPSSLSSTSCYRRLPVLRRVYELVSDGHLSEFDRVVVRWYDPDTEGGPTSSIDDDNEDDFDVNKDAGQTEDSEIHSSSAIGSPHEDNAPTENGELEHRALPTSMPAPIVDIPHQRLHDTIVAYDRGTNVKSSQRSRTQGATKSSNSTLASVKVRHMQMKGRAVGDKNRVKVEERFYVDLVIVVAEENTGDSDAASIRVVDSFPVFMARSDPLHRLIRDFVDASKLPALNSLSSAAQIDLLIPATASGDADPPALFRRIDGTHATFADAERDGVLQNFYRVVAYVHR